METSDSEYFESADEDFESDYEEPKKHHQLSRQNVNHKIVEPELCKLKINEGPECKDLNTQENVNDVNDIKIHSPQHSKPLDTKNIPDSRKTIADEKAIANVGNCEIQSNQNLEDTNSNYLKETIAPSSDNENAHTKPSKLSDKIATTTKTNQTSLIVTAQEDNLWDDDEIDWGSEAVKEESLLTQDNSPNSKNQDSGWDDFDADWESESPTTSNKIKEQTKPNPTKPADNPKVLPSTSKENAWDDDDDGWEPIEKPCEKPKEIESSWSGWGSWGVTSILTTATQSVSSITTHMSQGLSTVLESSIGIPEPEEMARINKLKLETENEQADKELHQEPSDNSPRNPAGFSLGNFVSGVSQLTKFVESTGTKVITGSLDTLEAIGKKTVEVLQDGDPGLKNKRSFLKLDAGKPNLSHILREAKERAEEENKKFAQKHVEIKRVKNYEALFDDHQGLVHLEALEMLSRLCNIKLQNLNNSLSGEALTDMQETLEQVKELCELPEDEDDDKVSTEQVRETISSAVKEINIPISYDKFFAACTESGTWLSTINLNFIDDVELHQQAIDTLAQLTALAVEQFHKTGELLLVKEHRSTADEADSLVQITTAVKLLIINEAGKFTDKLSTIENSDKDKISEYITNIFYEAENSGSYVQDAFQLLIPVLQVGAV